MLTTEDGFFPSNNLSAMITKQVSTTVCVNNYSGKKSGRKSASVVCCLFSDSDEPLCKPPKDARMHHLAPRHPRGQAHADKRDDALPLIPIVHQGLIGKPVGSV